MITEILPKKIWYAPVKNFEAVQEEISRAVKTAKWDYYQEKEGWGKSQKFAKNNPFNGDVITEFGMRALQENILSAMARYTAEYTIDQCIRVESWITKYDVGDYAQIHNHGHVPISGAYYYELTGEHNNFFFIDVCSGDRVHANLSPGDLILFPGNLYHGVSKVESGSRTVLSFNLRM
jgi:hypothetical protein